MQLVEQQTETAKATISIGPSIAVELSWVLLAARRDQLCTNCAALEELYLSSNELEQRVRSFWPDGVADFGELPVLADQAGLVGSVEIEELLAGIGDAAAHSPSELRLASETDSDRAVFLDRLDQLRRSPRLRRDYVQLLRDLWAAVCETWESEGRHLVDNAVERYRRRLERGARWVDLVAADSEHLSGLLPKLMGRLPMGGHVTIVPSFFSGQGLLFDLPGGILVGVRAAATDPSARARTDLLARRLKALADPTRLAIIESLAAGPMTVGEIALSFDLAQPTVSNHVKVLREAGIVTGARRGTRLELVVRKDAGNELLDELKALMDPSGEDDRQSL
ncbi:MAG TPA: metalloregulator ArsR/SmtB family transcription factor [Acidimicrobiales bacterium]|nr:metalloregulator ArsR/SmtB family transcription factor [Acidimicrobiales bacterium]